MKRTMATILLAGAFLWAMPSCDSEPVPDGSGTEQTDPSGGNGDDSSGGDQTDAPDGPASPSGPNDPSNPSGPDNPSSPSDPDDPDDPSNPSSPDTPDRPSAPEDLRIEVIDPGKRAPEPGVVTPHWPDLLHEVAYNDFYNPVQDALDEYDNVDYVCSKAGGTADPIITSDGHLLLYQGSSASKGGSTIRICAKNGARLEKVSLGSVGRTKYAFYKDGRISTRSETASLAAGEMVTVECGGESCTEICFICMGASQSERWEIDSVAVVWRGGFVEEDFAVEEEEYGPLVKVRYPFTENFEKDFPTTEKPSYCKYGITAGRENLQWSTWYGSFSWQNPVEGGQSVQLRVYQEEEDYGESQLGELKMEYFLKDLSKVNFSYRFSEFWCKAAISWCEFGSSEFRGRTVIALGKYSDRQTVQDFEYVLDDGRPHDAKIRIEIDSATGFPSSGHCDFYFDSFVFN